MIWVVTFQSLLFQWPVYLWKVDPFFHVGEQLHRSFPLPLLAAAVRYLGNWWSSQESTTRCNGEGWLFTCIRHFSGNLDCLIWDLGHPQTNTLGCLMVPVQLRCGFPLTKNRLLWMAWTESAEISGSCPCSSKHFQATLPQKFHHNSPRNGLYLHLFHNWPVCAKSTADGTGPLWLAKYDERDSADELRGESAGRYSGRG